MGLKSAGEWQLGDSVFHLMVANKYFLRTGSTSSLIIIVSQGSPNSAEIFALATGGSAGWGITWGAHNAYESELEASLQLIANRQDVVLRDLTRPAQQPVTPQQEKPRSAQAR